MSELFSIRQATLADMEMIVTQRRKMFEDMGHTDSAIHAAAEEAFRNWLRRNMEAGIYLTWFAQTADGEIVAGAGLWLQDWPPGYFDRSPYRGYIFNVYTEQNYRRKGLARRLVQAALDWCVGNNIRFASLHYSDEGRSLYEAMGFQHVNEMRIVIPPAS
jgi:GNAT superfamily N-acetyltransferase